MTERDDAIRVMPLDDGWLVRYASGSTDSFPIKDAALLAAQEAAMRTGSAVLLEADADPS